MKKTYLFALLSLATIFAFGQNRETRKVNDFSSISIGIPADVIINKGNTFKVVLDGDQEDLEDIETRVSGGRLSIKHENTIPFWDDVFQDKITVYITMPDLRGINLAGSGHIQSNDKFTPDQFVADVAGSGKIEVNIETNEMDINISGSGKIILKGSSNDADINISGSGDVLAEEFKIADCEINVMGSGNCRVYVTDRLETKIMGSGDVSYKGNPRNVNNNTMGSGKVRKI